MLVTTVGEGGGRRVSVGEGWREEGECWREEGECW